MLRMGLIQSVAHRYGLVMLAGSMLVGVGCAPKMRVVTDPPGATVTIRDARGDLVITQPAPVDVRVMFGRSNYRYIVEAEPIPEDRQAYAVTSREITLAAFRSLPITTDEDEEIRELKVELQSSEYQHIPVVKLALDPARGWIGFVMEERAYREVTEQGGAVPTRVVEFEEDISITGMALDHEGKRLVFSAADFGIRDFQSLKTWRIDAGREMPMRHANLYGVEVDGGGVQHITSENFQDLFPSFSNDGRSLLFCSNRRRADATDILKINAYGRGGISNIYVDHRGARAVKANQSQDGVITFALYPAGWNTIADVQIWTVGGSSKFPTQIARGIQPQISPNGKQIVFIGTDGNVWSVNSDGTGATQLTQGADQILARYRKKLLWSELAQFQSYQSQGKLLRHVHPFSYPSWSPDGRWILYTSMEGNDATGRPNEDIWVMYRDGTRKKQLTTNGSVDRYPVMSPDHRYVYFMSNRGLKWAIWRIEKPRETHNE